MARGWVYSDSKFLDIGTERWLTVWHVLVPGWKPEFEGDTPDLDRDLVYHCIPNRTREAAVCNASSVLQQDFFGCPTIQHQRVEWYVRADNMAHWEDVGLPEELAAGREAV